MKVSADDVLYVSLEVTEVKGKTFRRAVLVDPENGYERVEVNVGESLLHALPNPNTTVSCEIKVVQRNFRTYLDLKEIKEQKSTTKVS